MAQGTLKPVPQDKPEMIRVRHRQAPADFTVVLAKMADGSLVWVKGEADWILDENGEKKKFEFGHPKKSFFHPWHKPVDKEKVDALKSGVAEEWTFRWGNYKNETRQGQLAYEGWVPVKRDENLVICPFVIGDETTDNFCNVDVMLFKRPRELSEQIRRDQIEANDFERNMAAQSAMAEEAINQSGARVRGVRAEVRAVPEEAVKRNITGG